MANKVQKFFKELGDKIKTSVRMKPQSVFIFLALIMIVALGILVRCSPIFRTTALIKAFDPWIQYYTTEYLSDHTLFEFFNWESTQFWFPEGTSRYDLRPGLIVLCSALYKVLNFFGIPLTVYEVAYAWPVILGGLTILVMFFLGKEILDERAGLLAAFFLAFSPGHMQRTVLGFYDNETIGVFCVLAEFLFFIKCIKTGKAQHGVIAGIFLGVLCLSWGGLTYGILIIPLTALILIVSNKYSSRLLIAYCTTIGPGIMLYSMFSLFRASNVITEMDVAVAVFFMFFLIIYHVFDAQKEKNPKFYDTIWKIVKWGAIPALIVFGLIFWFYPDILPFGLGARASSIINPTIRNAINLVASVGEHKPSPWSVFYYNSLIPVILTPLGVYFAVKRNREEDVLMLVFVMTLLYFTGSMIRIILLLAPALALIGAYGLSHVLKFFGSLFQKEQQITRRRKRQIRKTLGSSEAVIVFLLIGIMGFTQINHAVNTSVSQMSWTEIVAGGSFHDWEESLSFMNENFDQEDVVVSWWDYGYWLSVIGNVTTVNDNGTMNQSRIGATGMAFMQTNEIYSAKQFQRLGADYVVVYFGYLVSGLGGDEGKWPWMLRICNDNTEIYENLGWREDNWQENEVFDEDEYINSTSGLYEDKWFDTTLVKMMFYGVPTTSSSVTTSLESYYAIQIEGNEAEGYSPRTDDDGDTWASHIPENGAYDFTCFTPYYISSSGLVKVFKVDYTALESSFELSDAEMYTNGIGHVEVENTGTRTIDCQKVQVNDIWYNVTMESGNSSLAAGESKTAWFNTNDFNQTWSIGDPYEVTIQASADALEGRTYEFTETLEELAVLDTPEYSVEIERADSKLSIASYDSPITVMVNITNTGSDLFKLDNMTLNGNSVTFLTEFNSNFIIQPGETQEYRAMSIGGFPGIDYDLEVFTVENATDEVNLAINVEDYKISIVSEEREIISEQMLYPENLQDLNRKLVFPNASETILYDNGTLLMTVENTGSDLIGIEGLSVNDELVNWNDWSLIEGSIDLEPGDTAKILADIGTFDKNEIVKVNINATGQGGISVASDTCHLIPVTVGKSISVLSSEVASISEIVANETVYVSVKNTGTDTVTVSEIALNETSTFTVDSSTAELLYGDFELDTFEVCKFAINVTGIKINQTDSVDLKVTASGVTDTKTFTATLPYDGLSFVVFTSTSYVDVSEDRMVLDIHTNSDEYNLTVDTIWINGTYVQPADMSFNSGENEISLDVSNLITIESSEFETGSLVAGEIYEIKITMVEGATKTIFIEVRA